MIPSHSPMKFGHTKTNIKLIPGYKHPSDQFRKKKKKHSRLFPREMCALQERKKKMHGPLRYETNINQ